ncbi:phage antirepressor protein [[Clostridium] sordellii]|uniref:hypothetical protein n=1 Tax=Paraclostridium sordellii TaxID=1505 RepID=UPI0005E5C50E|nr:hypothetical protein [Paeniclostridium sordellii]CEQ01715.1 phage antirepressor protein [[Clostridium] sordellii] [Paeniclostridium sordellii]
MSGLNVLNNEVAMISLEVVDLINKFRVEEGNRKELLHKNFMASIKSEIEALKKAGIRAGLNFQPGKWFKRR